MKHFLSRFGLTVALVVGLASLVGAQTTVTQTTLAVAVNQGDTFVTLTSATGVLANITNATTSGSLLFVDREALFVISLSGAVARVQRGYDSTFQDAHAVGAPVFVGQLGSLANGVSQGGPFVRTDPGPGGCLLTAESYSLRINTRTSTIWSCVNSTWMAVNDATAHTFKNYPGAGLPIASVAGVIAPTSGLFHITGALAITGITVPPGCATGCQITIIPDGAFTTTNATNIAIASTAVVSKALIMTWEPVAAKWFPSY
jgi:hypothetical protein